MDAPLRLRGATHQQMRHKTEFQQMKVGSRWLARKVLCRYALVNILTEANVTEGDSND